MDSRLRRLLTPLVMRTLYVARRLLFRTPLQRNHFVGLVYERVFNLAAPDLTKPVAFRGTTLYVDPENRSMVPSVVAGYYEARELDIFEALAAHSSLFFDVGANIGMYSVLGCRASSSLRVYAFEPIAENQAILERNIADHGLGERVRVQPVAASDHDGVATIRVVDDSGMHSFELQPGRGSAREVPTVTLDTFTADEGLLPDLVKIDVEGHEPAVLGGATRLFERCSPTVFVEYLAEAPDLEALVARLRSISERCFVIDGVTGKVTEIDTGALDRRRTYNLVLAPNPAHAAIVREFVTA
jgi:FkbM family methyltransferase